MKAQPKTITLPLKDTAEDRKRKRKLDAIQKRLGARSRSQALRMMIDGYEMKGGVN